MRGTGGTAPRGDRKPGLDAACGRARLEVGPRQGNPRLTLGPSLSGPTPAVRAGAAPDEFRECGSQPAHQSLIDRRPTAPPPALHGLRTLDSDDGVPGTKSTVPSALEYGHQSVC